MFHHCNGQDLTGIWTLSQTHWTGPATVECTSFAARHCSQCTGSFWCHTPCCIYERNWARHLPAIFIFSDHMPAVDAGTIILMCLSLHQKAEVGGWTQ